MVEEGTDVFWVWSVYILTAIFVLLHSKVLLSVSVTMSNGDWHGRPPDRLIDISRLDDTKLGISYF